MTATFNPQGTVSIAEQRLWEYLGRQMEKAGQKDSSRHLKHFLKAKASEPVVRGDLSLVSFEMSHRVSDYTIKLNALDGSVMGWHFNLLRELPGKELPVDKALELAGAEANPPPGAVLVLSEYQMLGNVSIFAARWEHEEDGVPVEGDYIHVQLNGKSGRSFAVHKRWHTLNFTPGER